MEKTLANKVKVIELLATKLSIKSEKDLSDLSMENLLELDGITITQMKDIQKLKKAVKENKLFSYLSESLQEQHPNIDDSSNNNAF